MPSIVEIAQTPLQFIDNLIDYFEDQIRQLHHWLETFLGIVLNFFL